MRALDVCIRRREQTSAMGQKRSSRDAKACQSKQLLTIDTGPFR